MIDCLYFVRAGEQPDVITRTAALSLPPGTCSGGGSLWIEKIA